MDKIAISNINFKEKAQSGVLFTKVSDEMLGELSSVKVSDLQGLSLTPEMRIAYVQLLNNRLVRVEDKELQDEKRREVSEEVDSTTQTDTND